MQYAEWQDKTESFAVMDVRHLQGNFFPALQKKAAGLQAGEGMTVIQTFEPKPLIAALEKMGFVSHVEQVAPTEFHTYFYRVSVPEETDAAPDTALRPLALLNYPLIDEELGKVAVDFWDLTWNDEKRTLPYGTRLLLSLTNAVGAGRMRQASRELVKAYSSGLDSRALDDVFELLAWNQGIGFFSSEIGPSPLFQAYRLIKNGEKKGVPREEIVAQLREKYGEKNPEVSVR